MIQNSSILLCMAVGLPHRHGAKQCWDLSSAMVLVVGSE